MKYPTQHVYAPNVSVAFTITMPAALILIVAIDFKALATYLLGLLM